MEQHNLVAPKPPGRSLLITIAMVIAGFAVVGPMLGLIVASMFYDGDLMHDFSTFANTPGLFYAIMVMQGITTLVGLIIFPWIKISLIEHRSISSFFPAQPKMIFVALIILVLAFNFIVAISPIVEWNADVTFPDFLGGFEQWARSKEDQLAKFTESITKFESIPDLLLGILVIALLPAIGEELVFRGLIQNEFRQGTNNIHLSIWVSAIIFSAIHIQFYGFIPRLLLGALFGYLYHWSGNLLVPIIAHFFNNAFSVVALYLYKSKMIETNMEEVDSAPWPAVIFSGVLTALLLFYLWKFFQQNPPKQVLDQNDL
jgi:membrane protease YdiL (CAAX protease family)